MWPLLLQPADLISPAAKWLPPWRAHRQRGQAASVLRVTPTATRTPWVCAHRSEGCRGGVRSVRAAVRSEGFSLGDLVALVTGKAKTEMGRGEQVPSLTRIDCPYDWATQGGGVTCAPSTMTGSESGNRRWGHAGRGVRHTLPPEERGSWVHVRCLPGRDTEPPDILTSKATRAMHPGTATPPGTVVPSWGQRLTLALPEEI